MLHTFDYAYDIYVAQTKMTVEALEEELNRIKERGYEVVSVTSLHDSYVITAVEKTKGE